MATGRGPRPRAPVFYNPSMALDRDLGVAFVRAWHRTGSPSLSGWEVTAATGVRGLRLIHETDAFGAFLFTETNDRAFRVLQSNVAEVAQARARQMDGRTVPEGGPFEYVDIDPYGSPSPFLEATLPATRTGGVLAVTATDMMVLAGAQPSVARRKYGVEPVRGRLGPEGGLRILLALLATKARSTDRTMRPLLSYVRDHHVRAYVEITGGGDVGDPVGSIDPENWDGPPLGGARSVGPFWLGPLFDRDLVARLEVPPTAERPRELGSLLSRFREEASVPSPFFYEANSLGKSLHLASPPSLRALLSSLAERGFRAARTHARPEGFRTDAPRAVVEAAARETSARTQSQKARVRA